MANGTAYLSERSKNGDRRVTWTRLLGRRRVAATPAGERAPLALTIDAMPEGEGDAVLFAETKTSVSTATEEVIEADSAAYFLHKSHALVAELRVVVAVRVSTAR